MPRVTGSAYRRRFAAAAHPIHDGLVSTVDYEDTGALTLREVRGRQAQCPVEVEDVSGESLHTVEWTDIVQVKLERASEDVPSLVEQTHVRW